MFPESIAKMLSLIYDNSDISNNMIIIMSLFFPFWDKNTHMNVSITIFIIFALSSIDKYYLQLLLSSFHYCSIYIIVSVIHKYGIIWYRILFWIGISMIWNKTHVPAYSHFAVVAAIYFISFLFQTLTLISFSFSYYQSTILMSICITNFIVVAILICLVVCWTWIDTSIQNRHRFNPSIIHSRDINKSKWLNDIKIEYTISL